MCVQIRAKLNDLKINLNGINIKLAGKTYIIIIIIIIIIFVKESYPIVRHLEKITVKKAQAKVVKYAKNNIGSLRPPPGHLSVNNISKMFY